MNCLDQVKLPPLMALTSGVATAVIGLIDGPVDTAHPDFASTHFLEISSNAGQCALSGSLACQHGTFVTGIMSAKRDSPAPAICPDCTLVIRPIFTESSFKAADLPSATPGELANAIKECIDAGAWVLNISAAIASPSTKAESSLVDALNLAAKRGVLVVCAAGNQGLLGSTAITRHPWVTPAIAVNTQGRPLSLSNLGNSIGQRGLAAPGEQVTSLGTDGKTLTSGGTSAAAPFVTGTIALLWSLFPQATATQIKLAVIQANGLRRNSVSPPLLDAWSAYQTLSTMMGRKLVA